MITSARLARPLALLVAFAAAAASLAAQPQTYAVDSKASRVRIQLGRAGLMKFLGHEHEIDAPVAEGRVEVMDGDPARSGVALRFESARLSVVPGSEPAADIPKVEERMRGPEVLDVARYPEIAFVSTSVRSQAQNGSRFLRDLGIEPPSVGVVNVANRFRLEFEIRATAAPTPGVTP